MKLTLQCSLTLLLFSAAGNLFAQLPSDQPVVGKPSVTIAADQHWKIRFSLPAGTKMFYVNIADSADNIVSTDLVTLRDASPTDSGSAGRIRFDSAVWVAPQIYDDAPDSLDYPNEKAFYYAGVDYRGQKTKVFAYLGFPADALPNIKVPGVILVPGALGTAFPQWVKIWNDRGYAAITMDLEGREPPLTHHDMGGPRNTLFADTTEAIEDQWLYHAVANVYLAYSLLASDERVDKTRIGITGISWGGIVASLAIGNADCFAFAIPVYGCGYLHESKGLYRALYNATVTKQWDASHWLRTVTTPTLWINGDADRIFSMDATTKTARATRNSQLAIIPGLQHSHGDGWSPREIYAFANSIVQGGRRLVKILKQPGQHDLTVDVDASGSHGIKSAVLISSHDTLSYDAESNPTTVWLRKPIDPSSFLR